MASGRAPKKLSQLWQGPLLVASVGLFGYSAYRFIDPKFVTAGERIQGARDLLAADRPEAALDYLNKVLASGKVEGKSEGEVHLLMAESIRQVQKRKHISIAVNHERIVRQVQVALGLGVRPTAAIEQMLGESYEELGRPADALASYRLAMGLDHNQSVGLEKKVIELQIESGDPAAEGTLAEYLSNKDLSDSERAWALGEKAQILINRQDYAAATGVLKEALKPAEVDPVAQGQVNYQLGYCAYTTGKVAEAERYLRLAREQLRVQHPMDADACYLLGKIHEGRGEAEEAKSFYQVVLMSHPDAKVVPLALLGRGMCRLMLGESEAGLGDLHDLVGQINTRASRSKYKDDVIEGLKRASSILSAKEKYQDSLEAMAYEQELRGEPEGEFFARLGAIYEKRAGQVERPAADEARGAEQLKRQQQVRELRSKAGDAYVAYSKSLRLHDDKGYGEALWRGIDLYDRAGDLQRAIGALELFVAERPADSLAPDAMLRLGRAYQAVGLFDKAVHTFLQNQLKYPRSLAATKSMVPLAQAYVAKGPEYFAKAEEVLLGVVQDNPVLTPDAEEFKQGLFELAQLYYRTQRYEEAVQRLDEWTRRYPKDERLAQMAFLMADSYRKSAALLDVKPQTAAAAGGANPVAAAANTGASLADPAEVKAAKRERLTNARRYYDQVIELSKMTPPEGEIARLQLKLSHFYRADAMYDLGEYAEAIKLYDAAALRYQDDPSALAAYVQIVNAYCAMGKREEAKAANERVKWLLRRMPPESFAENQVAMPKDHWEQWLKWASASGMW